MQDRHLFEYAVIRVVPRVEREEFFNAGVIVYCAKKRFLKASIYLDHEKLVLLSPGSDVSELQLNLESFKKICEGGEQAGPIGLLSQPERFRWLTSTRSTIIQSSKVHPGFCVDPDDTLNHLFQTLVL